MNNLPSDWDNTQKSLKASILQSAVWSDFQQSLERESHHAGSDHWSYIAFERKNKGIKYLFAPYGPTASSAGEEALRSLVEYATKHGYDFVRVEPIGNFSATQLDNVGAIKISEVDPAHTQVLDLLMSEAELRSGLKPNHRNLINGTARRGIKIEQSSKQEDLQLFCEMLKDTARHSKVKFYDDSYYLNIWKTMQPKGNAKLYIARVEGAAVATALFYDYNGVRYYAHAGAFQDMNRKSNAAISLLWQAIVDAKSIGMHKFDLWGVAPDNNPNHKWAGISSFKKGFGGETVSYLGTYDIPIKKSKYKLYSSIQKIRGRG